MVTAWHVIIHDFRDGAVLNGDKDKGVVKTVGG